MLETILQKIGVGIVSASLVIGGWLGISVDQPKVGASVNASTPVALFETTLAERLTTTGTSMTLSSATTKDGTTLASSTYGFIIDEGQANEEFVLADCTGTTCTNLTRGLSVLTGTSTVTALKKEHRRGASVKITDAPSLVYLANVVRGSQNIENPLRYDSNLTFTEDTHIVSKKYVDDTAFSGAGVVDASTVARGVSEIATAVETASSTSNGGSGTLVIPASNATSTYNANTAALRVVVTQNDGKIDSNFFSSSAGLAPVGSITAYATGTPPTGWFLCDGTAYSKTTYPNLFSVIGYSYASTTGGNLFQVPDLRGRAIAMASSTQVATSTYNRATLGATGGETKHTMKVNELASHTHTTGSAFEGSGSSGGTTNVGIGQTTTSGSTGSGVDFNVLDPYMILNYIIKY